MDNLQSSLPAILCGPMVRRLTDQELVIWLVTPTPGDFAVNVTVQPPSSAQPSASSLLQDDTSKEALTNKACYSLLTNEAHPGWEHHCIPIGSHAYVRLFHFTFPQQIASGSDVAYDLICLTSKQNLAKSAADLLLPGESEPKIVFKKTLDNVLHGSCRKPHFSSQDALLQVDKLLLEEPMSSRPGLLMMAGDQIYADDVAGPLLVAIHQVIHLLGLHQEALEGATVDSCSALYQHDHCYYQRAKLLPDDEANEQVEKRFLKGKKKPIFTSVHAENHLITAAEIYAMYLLVWSPALWEFVDLDKNRVAPEFLAQYESEKALIIAFQETLPAVSRVFAHIPTYMIFDDHDVTDDWNLTRGWEQAAYENPYSRRIIGNAMIGYWLFQGIGNQPQVFNTLFEFANTHFSCAGIQEQDALISQLLDFSHWHYVLPTEPKCVVLDTRTHRWRSEKGDNYPSGLMDWESLTQLQHELYEQERAIIVSAAPIFGVKLIETIQKIFTFFGKALVVDAENWMAHRGTAKVILETFLDKRTPNNITVLSGDVHYSFVYDVYLRSERHDQQARVVQITSSGIKNAFPDTLLTTFDKLNRFIYGRWSLFNWFTKRRRLLIRPRKPNSQPNRTLFNSATLSRIHFDLEGEKVHVELLCHDGKRVHFIKK